MTDGLVRVDDVAGASVVVLAGEVDARVTPDVRSRLPEVVEQGRPVVLDLSEVTFFDSSGVRLVDLLARSCAEHGLRWRVVAPGRSPARRVLELVELDGPEVVEDRAVALLQVAG